MAPRIGLRLPRSSELARRIPHAQFSSTLVLATPSVFERPEECRDSMLAFLVEC
jgi:hypothetical protein